MSDINTNATVTLTVNGKQAQDMLDNLKKKSQDLEKAIENAAKKGNKADLKRLQKELKQTNRQITQIESATVGVEKVLKNLDKATPKELNKTLYTLKQQLNGIERGTVEWNRQAEAIKRVKSEIARVNADLIEGEGFWDRFNRKMNDWQTTLMGMIAAITGLIMAGRSAVKAFADMDAEMANVRKFTGMTKEQVEDLNEEFKKMDTRTAREQLNVLAEDAGKLGKQSKEDIIGFVRAADQINVALDELGDGATLTLSKLTTIFGDEERLGTEKALLSVGSVINELSQNCTASAPYLANFAKRMAGVGAQAEMTIPQIMGFAAVLDSQGQAVEMSATAVSKLIMDMFKQQDKIIKATGMNAEKFKEALSRSTNEGLLMLLDTLNKLGNIDVLAPVFKDMGENGARAAQVISALAGNLNMVKWEQEEAARAFEEATSVTKEYNVQNTTVQASLDKARKRVTEMAVELGEKLQPVMKHVLSSTTMLLKFLSTLVDFIVKYKVEIASVTVSIIAYNVAINLATIRTKAAAAAHVLMNAALKTGHALMIAGRLALLALSIAYDLVTGNALRAALATKVFTTAIKSNPIGLLVTTLTAAVAAIIAWQAKVRSAREEQERLNREARQAAREIRDVEASIAEETSTVKRLKDAIDSENVGSRKRNALIKEFNSKFGSYLSNLLNEKSTAQDLADAYKEVVKNIRAKMLLEAKEKDMKKNAGVRYGWEAKKLSDYDKIARDKNSAMTGAWLKAAVDEEFEKMQKEGKAVSAKDLSKAVFSHHIAPQRVREGYYNSEENQLDTSMGEASESFIKQYVSTRAYEQRVNKKWAPYSKEIDYAIEQGMNLEEAGDSGLTPEPEPEKDTKTQKDRFKTEKEWKAKEEAMNRISYATGKENYEQYQKRILEIEVEYQTKILNRCDLTDQEKLTAQAEYYETKKKQAEQGEKITVEQETQLYNEAISIQKQRYIDGEISTETYQQTLEILELNHLRRMTTITEEGSKENIEAQKAYQDKLIADQKKRQQETESAEKKHQDHLKQLKKDYFGDNKGERVSKYMADLEALREVYKLEVKAAGDSAEEKLRIEEAYQKAKKALRKKYGIDELDDNKSFLEEWNEDMQEWLQSDMGKAVTGSLDVISSGMSSIFQQMSTLVQAEADIQVAAIEKRYKTEISNAEGNNYQVKKIEEKKEKEVAKVKNEANKKMYKMQVMQAIAQTATAALNAYSSAAAVPVIGYILAPIAAATAAAAGLMQVEAIKKQQEAASAQGYSKGGFTPEGGKYEVAGVVHKGEWVASQELLHSPVARPMIEALDYAQRTNTIGSLRSEDVSRSIVAPSVYAQSGQSTPTVIVQQSGSDAQAEIAATHAVMKEYATVIRQLKERLDEPFVTVNTVTGDTGIKQAQDEYEQLMRNKTPKSRRK